MIIVKDTKHRLNPEGVTENTDSSYYPFGIIVVLCHPFGVVNLWSCIGYNPLTPSGLPHIYP
ncbi:MAG: hypothetical protein ACUBOA_10265 [Candidatus Loosdrechtia sp.]